MAGGPLPALRVAWYAFRVLFTHVMIEPIRGGGPRPMQWTVPVRVVMGAALAVVAVLAAAIPLARLAGPPPEGLLNLSTPGRWLVVLGTSMLLYCIYLASTRLHLVWQLVVGTLLAPSVILGIGASFLVAERLGRSGPVLFFVLIMPVQLATWVILCVVGLRSRNQPLTARRSVLTAVAFALAYTAPQAFAVALARPGDVALQVMQFTTITILVLCAMPLAVASGVAFSEITVSAVSWAAITVRPLVPRIFWIVLVAGCVALHGFLYVRQVGFAPRHQPAVATAAAVALGTLAAGWLALRLARARGPVDAPRPVDVADSLGGAALMVGLVHSGWVVPAMLMRDQGDALRLWSLVVAAFCALLCALAVWRGRTVTATLQAVFAIGYVVNGYTLGQATLVRDVVTLPLLGLVLVGALIWWGVRGRLRTEHWIAVATGLVLTLVWPFRDAISEPIDYVLDGSSGGLVFGLAWRVLTDGGFTRVGTRRFPIEARSLLFGAYVLTAATASVTVYYGADNDAYSLDNMAVQGVIVMGRFALFAVVLGLLETARFHVDPDPEAPPPPLMLDR